MIELWPFGDYYKTKTLSVATITNDGTGSKTEGNYKVKLSNGKNSEIKGFNREQDDAWKLLYLALESLYNGKK